MVCQVLMQLKCAFPRSVGGRAVVLRAGYLVPAGLGHLCIMDGLLSGVLGQHLLSLGPFCLIDPSAVLC